MKKFSIFLCSLSLSVIIVSSCAPKRDQGDAVLTVRPLKDTTGFAHYPWQVDSIMKRIVAAGWHENKRPSWQLVICPHDDYTYTGYIYPQLLQNVRAKNLFLIGVAHKAAKYKIEDSLVFDSYRYWKGPWDDIPVSPVREELLAMLKGKCAIVNDTLHKAEHSLEGLVPYLQYFNHDITIVPILVPSMSPARMEECGKQLAEAISSVASRRGWIWGQDYAIVATTDAVHYGDEDWGGSNMAPFGCDAKGNGKAVEHEFGIIDSCLTGVINPEKIRLFNSKTLNDKDYHVYKWTWCGRYSIPLALYTGYYLGKSDLLNGETEAYSTSILNEHIKVDDLQMGTTAIATAHHWVGYAAIGYRTSKEPMRGIITISVANMRRTPDHSAELVSQAIMGTPVVIDSMHGSWVKIATPDNYSGWAEAASVSVPADSEYLNLIKGPRIIFNRNYDWIHQEAAPGSPVISDIVGGSILRSSAEKSGYIKVILPDGREGFIEKAGVKDYEEWKNDTITDTGKILNTAYSYMGIPYLWGGSSVKGADCSGFVQNVFFRNGIQLERDAHLQALHGKTVDITHGYNNLQKGDLLFFGSMRKNKPHITHVAIYCGNMDYINSAGRVQINSLDSTKPGYVEFRIHTLLEAKRINGFRSGFGISNVKDNPWYN